MGEAEAAERFVQMIGIKLKLKEKDKCELRKILLSGINKTRDKDRRIAELEEDNAMLSKLVSQMENRVEQAEPVGVNDGTGFIF